MKPSFAIRTNLLSARNIGIGIIFVLICAAVITWSMLRPRQESKHCCYWLLARDMNDVDVRSLVSVGTTDVFLHEHVFALHRQKNVEEWIVQADAAGLKVHIWMQTFYNGKWSNPVKDDAPDSSLFDEIIARAQSYARLRGVAGIHLDHVRYPGNAYKTRWGADAISDFVQLAVTRLHQTSPRLIVSMAVMPEPSGNLHYYGLDYGVLSRYLDVVVAMTYKQNYNQKTSWVKKVTTWFVQNSKGAKVWAGLQGYKADEDASKLPISEITADVEAALEAGADGVVIFRWGVTNFVKLP